MKMRFEFMGVLFLLLLAGLTPWISAQSLPPITGPQGDPSKGPVITPPASNPPQSTTRPSSNNNSNSNSNFNFNTAPQPRNDNPNSNYRNNNNPNNNTNAGNPNAGFTPSPSFGAQLQQRLASLQRRYDTLDAQAAAAFRLYKDYEAQGAAAAFEYRKASTNVANLANELIALKEHEPEILAIDASARNANAVVMKRIYAEMAQDSDLMEVTHQVQLAKDEREEARSAALTTLRKEQRYQAQEQAKSTAQEKLVKLRAGIAPVAPVAAANASSQDPQQIEINAMAQQVVQSDKAIFEMEKTELAGNERFQQADAVYDAVTKRYNLVHSKLEEEYRKNPDRIAVQKLLEEAIANVKMYNERIASTREQLDTATVIATDAQQKMRDLDNIRAQYEANYISLQQDRINLSYEINRLSNLLAAANAP